MLASCTGLAFDSICPAMFHMHDSSVVNIEPYLVGLQYLVYRRTLPARNLVAWEVYVGGPFPGLYKVGMSGVRTLVVMSIIQIKIKSWSP